MSDDKHIEAMETILNDHKQLLDELDILLNKFEGHQKAYQILRDYYTSESYMEDYELSNQGHFDHINCGVLSEDAVFNLLTDQYQLGIRLLEIGTDIMKNH